MVAGPVSSGMVSGTTAMLAPMAALLGAVFHLVRVRLGLGRLGVEHVQRADQQQHAAADLEAGQRDAEKIQDLQAQQRAGGNHHKGAERRRSRSCGVRCSRRKALRVVDEKRHDGQRIDDGQQRDQRFEVHRSVSPGRAGDRPQGER